MGVRIVCADSFEFLKTLEPDSLDWCVTDPPYGLNPDLNVRTMIQNWMFGHEYSQRGRGFMGKDWDKAIPPPKFWKELLRVLKPGAHACVFAATKTEDLMGLSLRLAGFEIRDCLDWLFGTGFPKGTDLGEGKRSLLKPAREPIFLVRKPIGSGLTLEQNVSRYGVGALNVEACSIPYQTDDLATTKRKNPGTSNTASSTVYGEMRPQQIVNEAGRFPSNVILDEEAAAVLDAQSGERPVSGRGGASRFFYVAKASKAERQRGCEAIPGGNRHPTVKPIKLIRYLIRIVAPPGSTGIDPFLGSGTTAVAAIEEGYGLIGIEREPESVEISNARVSSI